MNVQPPPVLDDHPHAPGAGAKRRPAAGRLVIIAGVTFFALVCGLFAASAVIRATKSGNADNSRQTQAVLNDIQAQAAARNAEMRAKLDSEEGLPVDASGMDESQKMLADAAARLEGNDKKIVESIAHVTGKMRPHVEKYAEALNAYAATGGSSGAGLASTGDIDVRLGHISRLRESSDALKGAFGTIQQDLEAELLKRGVPAKVAKEASFGATQGMKLPQQLRVRKSDEEIFDASRDQLELLKSRWGKWEYDASQDAVLFESEADNAKFNELFERVQKASEEQAAAQREILSGE